MLTPLTDGTLMIERQTFDVVLIPLLRTMGTPRTRYQTTTVPSSVTAISTKVCYTSITNSSIRTLHILTLSITSHLHRITN
jgi:hypothetical protein